MKIGVITYHRALNFGAVLQAFALKTSIARFGVDCQIIDYKSEKFEKEVFAGRLKKLMTADNISAFIIYLIYGYNLKMKRKRFLRFANDYLTKTKEYTIRNIAETNEIYDAFVTGSDQVWNCECCGFDKTYFLDFVKDQRKKNSYAASFGFDEIPQALVGDYKCLLSDYYHISVRERQGAQIIKKLLDRDVPVTLDPTLLLDEKAWSEILIGYRWHKDYILVYEMAHSPTMIAFADKLSRETGCKVIFISNAVRKKLPQAINVAGVGPREFLGLFKSARYVVTNSFHGTCFSVVFNKQFFVELLPPPSRVNSRIEHIMDMLALRHRQIATDKDFSFSKEINYWAVNDKLNVLRNDSLTYLRGVIEQV